MPARRPAASLAAYGLLSLAMMTGARPAGAVIVPPAVRALELPVGVVSVSATDPLLAPILTAASTIGSPVTNNLGSTVLTIGKTPVTWTETTSGATLTKYIYLYPAGWQVLGWTGNLRVFEHNGCRHILYDTYGRVHVIYNDAVDVWYRLGVRSGRRVDWQAPVQVNDAATPIGISSSNGTRGQTFGMIYDASGNVILQCTWSSSKPVTRSVWTRRLTVDTAGSVTAGTPVNTGLIGSFQCIVADSTGRFHLAVEKYSDMLYANSVNGVDWVNNVTWNAAAGTCTAYRFPNLLVDPQDRLHLLWQAESYQGYSSRWWVLVYSVRDPQTGQWTAPVNALSGIPGWEAPTTGERVLAAYPNMVMDDRQNLHLAWHGSVYSNTFGWDDTFYMKKPYYSGSGTWGPWGDYVCLHRRDHFNNGQGEDMNHSWVPSLAYVPGSSEFYAMFMYGLVDDEVSDPSVNATEGALKTFTGAQWLAGFANLTQTPAMRSWYMNAPSQVLVDPNGHKWLDMIWVDGTLDDYNVIFRRIDLGGGLAGDVNVDEHVDVSDLLILARSWSRSTGQNGFDPACDLNNDNTVDAADLLILAGNWGT